MIGSILKELRVENGLTQQKLADKLDISKSTIAMIESSKREGSKEIEFKIANFFGVSLDYLDGRTKEKNINNINSKSKMLDDFLDTLIAEGIISESDDIDDDVAEMIINAVKAQVALKLKKHEKGDK